MHHVKVGDQINLPSLIFQDLIKVVYGSIKTTPYGMHLSYIIMKARCNVTVNPPLQLSKYTSFDKYTFRRMQYVMDTQRNYVKKLGRALEQPELEGQHELER